MTEQIERLALRGFALRGALALLAKHPDVIFTSGRRTLNEQARAMAGNVVINRRFIAETYLPCKVALACQEWVDANPFMTTGPAITVGLKNTMARFGVDELNRLSKHLSGDAFDVLPVTTADGDDIKATIRGLEGLDKFLEREGGLVRWHAQFRTA